MFNKKILLTIILGIFLFSFASAALTDGLISYYTLNENSGTVYDILGNYNLTNTGVTLNQSGIIGTSGEWTGASTDKLQNLDFDINFNTVNLWVNLTSFSNYDTLFNFNDGGNDINVYHSGGLIFGNYADSPYAATIAVNFSSYLNKWTMITALTNATHMKLFIDGVEVGNVAKVTNTFGTLKFTIGNNPGATTRSPNGKIDEVGIWNRELNSTEIENLNNSGEGLQYPFAGVNSDPTVNLLTPLNNSKEIETLINFTSNITISNNFNHTNQTLYIWEENGTFFKSIQNNYTGDNLSIISEWSTNGFTIGENYLWNVLACGNDSVCNWATQNFTFVRNIISENNITYRNWTIEGGVETFILNFDRASTVQVSTVNLSYNGTNYTTSLVKTGDNTIATAMFAVPTLSASENLTFFFIVTMENGDVVNSDTYTQLVKNLLIDDCSSYTNKVFNLTLLDEETQVLITGKNQTIQTFITLKSYGTEDEVMNYTGQFINNNTIEICISENLSEILFSVDAVFRYFADDYEIETYNLLDFTLAQSEIPQYIKLFNLLSADSTSFKITFKDASNIIVKDALISINRRYVEEGSFKTVELPKTDSNGQAIAHLVENDVLYNIIVTKDNVVLANYEEITAFCEDATINNCYINLVEDIEAVEFFNYDLSLPISSELGYNTTSREVTLDFTSKDGSTRLVQLIIEKNDMLGNGTVCNESISSSSGTLSCTIPITVGDTGLIVYIKVDGDLMSMSSLDLKEKSPYGAFGYFIMFIFTLAIVLMFSSSKSGMIIGSIIGFIGTGLLSLQNNGINGLFASLIYLLIAGFILLWRINRDRGSN